MPQNNDILLCDYYRDWITMYKEGAVRDVTLRKYQMSLQRLSEIVPDLKLSELTRIRYQQIINEYAKTHERQTTMDFHHQLKGAVLDALDDGLLEKDPTRKVMIKGKPERKKKPKFLSKYDLKKLLDDLDLTGDVSWDWCLYLIAKTGLRFSEAVAVTPADFDFRKQILNINKTWDYKTNTGFQKTKNKSSVRKIRIDWQLAARFSELVKDLPEDQPVFATKEKIYNSTVNDILARHCVSAGVPVISVHSLRHTHASILLYDGVSIASVAKRLGHSSMNTTQKVYLHVIQELENADTDLVMRSMADM